MSGTHKNMQTEATPKLWIDAAIPSFVVHLVISTVGAMLVGIVAILIPSLLIAVVAKTPGSSLIDRMVDQPLFRIGSDPYFAGPILAGFILRCAQPPLFPVSLCGMGLGPSGSHSHLECDDVEIPHRSIRPSGCMGQLLQFRLWSLGVPL